MTGVERRSWRRTAALPLIWLLKAYQYLISPLTPATCRFYPSCSSYAVTALERHGPLRGGWLATRRLLRCHPWNPGGVDHVPLSGHPGHRGHREESGSSGTPSPPGGVRP